jgi:hypothetical protein
MVTTGTGEHHIVIFVGAASGVLDQVVHCGQIVLPDTSELWLLLHELLMKDGKLVSEALCIDVI